ncbi:putative disease resistance protein RGA3 [Miscanthus floridulus]|uniref:putative disease resistance protein RGA3 n=1 Tax=Miscanthus floridulus TaxID=154761 RepID=UPI00345904BE
MRHFTTDRYIKQEIRNLLKDICSVSKNRPLTLTSRNMGDDQHDRSCDGQELMRHDNLVEPEKIEMRILPLVDKLTEHHEPSRQFIIFAIYGLGGVGKTTIARKIFDDQRTQSAFSTRVWVSISKGSSVAQILQATCAAPSIGVLEVPKTKNKLQMLLADKIGGRRIFLVFNIHDGVPSKQGIGNAEIFGNLIEVLKFFHAAAEGSHVLITTSDENVGNEIKSAQIQKGAEGYGLQTDRIWQLTVEDSWMLLLRAACLEQAKITPELKQIGIGILQKCNCLPLAIEAVGGVLRQKGYRQKEWEGIRDSRAFSLKDPTTGTEGVRSSIYLSYQYAPPHLKQCFLYLSLLPVDFEIEQHLVTQLWISEGLIDIGTRHGHSLEETADEQSSVSQQESNKHNNSEETAQEPGSSEIVIVDDENNASSEHARENTTSSQGIVEGHNRQPPKGSPCVSSSGHSSKTSLDNKQSHCLVQEMADSYFKELAERGLVQRENKTKRYKMHEQVRKIADSLTENEVCAGDPKYVATMPASLYRLSFLNKGLTTIPEDVGRLKSLKTLLLSGNSLGETDMDSICKNLELLRVLDLSDTEIQSVPKTLGNLVYLRHLNLSRTRIRALHESIGRLRRLRFLGLRECEHLTSLPKSIQKLLKLEYLDFRDTGITKSTRLHNLRHLTLLHGFVVGSMSSYGLLLEDLQNMSDLSDLQIDIRKIVDRNIERDGIGMLKEKGNLRNLEIRCCTVNSENLSAGDPDRLKTMFTQLHPPQCLVSLKIDGYHGTVYPEWLCFSELPNLQHLSLENCKSCGGLPPIWHLQKLKFLRIANLSKLQTIDMQPTAEMPSFPNVEELEIEDMEVLEYWSDFQAGDLPHLRKLALRRCPKLKRLPGGLEHCKIISTMELIGAGLVQVLEKIHVQELIVEAMPSLTEVSNLPLMKAFTVISCPNLGIVSGVNSLQHIHMEDEQLEQLPKWLGQHFSRIETLDIEGKEQLLARCERNKEDWYIVREIPRVYAYLPKRLPYFSYARSSDFFCKYKRQRTDARKDHLHSPEAGVQRTGFTVSSSSRGNDDSPLGPAAPVDETGRKFLSLGPPPTDETYKKILSVMSLFVVIVLWMIMNLTDSHHNLLEDLSLFGFYVCTMFYFIFLVMKRRR